MEPVEHVYFNWLCAKVEHLENSTPSLSHLKLFNVLHRTEFVWVIIGDDNRYEDGVELRYEFAQESRHLDVGELEKLGCSIFEMLISFSRRASFQTDMKTKDWFWIIINNLGLGDLNDSNFTNPDDVVDILARFVWRTYDFNGEGGMFPLDHTDNDQRKVEIWYQFCEYLEDQEYI